MLRCIEENHMWSRDTLSASNQGFLEKRERIFRDGHLMDEMA